LVEVKDFAVETLAANDGGARRSGYGEAEGANGDLAVVADADGGGGGHRR
jgi:hypothetical protein